MRRFCRGIGRAAIVLGLVLSGCEGESGAKPGATVRDSLGIQITEIATSAFQGGASWTVDAEPLVVIGRDEAEPSQQLHQLSVSRRLADGSIVVADGGSLELRVFSTEGRFVRSFGGRGDGPGEFQSIDWVQVSQPDTILVLDSARRRITALSVESGLIWTLVLESTGYSWPADFRLPDGSFLLLSHEGSIVGRARSAELATGVHRNTSALVHYASDGTLVDTIGRFPGLEEALVQRDNRFSATYPPWGKAITHAVSEGRVVVGTQEKSELEVFSHEGRTLALLRWQPASISVGPEQLNAFNASMLARARGDTTVERAIEARIASLPHPEIMPEHGRVVWAEDGRIWLSEPFMPVREPTRWSILELGRGVVGQIALPEGFRVFEVGADYVLGRMLDELGVESVVFLRLNQQGT